MSDTSNQAQIDFWNGEAGLRWVRHQERMDGVIRPLGDAAIAAANVRAGEKVLDVGCGCGDTSLALTALGAEVTGVDVSAQMLERARARASGSATFELADAATATLRGFDLVFSRFGVMFFADPVAAFTNLRAAGKRLSFVCWRAPQQNPWAMVPLAAVAPLVPGPLPDPNAPGPFAFADDRRVRDILERAGWRDVAIAPVDRQITFSTSTDLEANAAFFSEMGPTARLFAELDAPTRVLAEERLKAAIAPHISDAGLILGAAVWVVTATAAGV